MKKILSIILLVISISLQASADNKSEAIETITSEYSDWNAARLNCKLSATGLMVSPSVKIYMERDKTIQISISAIFVGEVGRIEITKNRVFAVNKMKNVYCDENLSDFFDTLPVSLSDVQNLLLGRIFLLGEGVLSQKNSKKVEILEREDGGWDVLPATQPDNLGIAYGYSTYSDGKMRVGLVEAPGGREVAMEYIYKGNSRKMEIEYSGMGKYLQATLDIKETLMNAGAPLSPLKVKDSWNRVSAKQFLKSLS